MHSIGEPFILLCEADPVPQCPVSFLEKVKDFL